MPRTADVCGDADDVDACALSLASRLVPADEASRVAALVADARLMRSGLRVPHTLERHEILQLATHLATVDHARQAHELAVGDRRAGSLAARSDGRTLLPGQ